MQNKSPSNIDFFYELHQALESRTFDGVEYLRDFVTAEYAKEITEIYELQKEWDIKELIIHLVQDQDHDNFSLILEDAIHAPSAESKAYSICYRQKDRSIFSKYLKDHVVDPESVNKDVKKYLAPKKWWQWWK